MNHLKITNTDTWEWTKYIIAPNQIEALKTAKYKLSQYLDMEIIYDLVLQEFQEFHSKVNYWKASRPSIRNDYILNHDIRNSLNRLAFNLLNLSKLYLDHHYNEKKGNFFSYNLTLNEDHISQVKSHREHIYKTNLEYVVACKLRNKAQHNSLPVSTFTTGVSYNPLTNVSSATFKIYYSYNDLIGLKVPREMFTTDTKLDLTCIMNNYVTAISEMHSLNRKLTETVVNDSIQIINSTCEEKASLANYCNYISELNLESGESIHLGLDWFDVAKYLISKNQHPTTR